LIALLGCRSYRNIVDSVWGKVWISLEKANKGGHNHVIGAGVPIHPLIAGSTERCADTVNKNYRVSLHAKPFS
jgi:hypothetical protein